MNGNNCNLLQCPSFLPQESPCASPQVSRESAELRQVLTELTARYFAAGSDSLSY